MTMRLCITNSQRVASPFVHSRRLAVSTVASHLALRVSCPVVLPDPAASISSWHADHLGSLLVPCALPVCRHSQPFSPWPRVPGGFPSASAHPRWPDLRYCAWHRSSCTREPRRPHPSARHVASTADGSAGVAAFAVPPGTGRQRAAPLGPTLSAAGPLNACFPSAAAPSARSVPLEPVV